MLLIDRIKHISDALVHNLDDLAVIALVVWLPLLEFSTQALYSTDQCGR